MHACGRVPAGGAEFCAESAALAAGGVPAVDAAFAVSYPDMEARRVARAVFACAGKELFIYDLKLVSAVTAFHSLPTIA